VPSNQLQLSAEDLTTDREDGFSEEHQPAPSSIQETHLPETCEDETADSEPIVLNHDEVNASQVVIPPSTPVPPSAAATQPQLPSTESSIVHVSVFLC